MSRISNDLEVLKLGFVRILRNILKEVSLEFTSDFLGSWFEVLRDSSIKRIVLKKDALEKTVGSDFFTEELVKKTFSILYDRYQVFFTHFKEDSQAKIYEFGVGPKYECFFKYGVGGRKGFGITPLIRHVPFVSKKVELFSKIFDLELNRNKIKLRKEGIRHMLETRSVDNSTDILILLTEANIKRWHKLSEHGLRSVGRIFINTYLRYSKGNVCNFKADPFEKKTEIRLTQADFKGIEECLKTLNISIKPEKQSFPVLFQNPPIVRGDSKQVFSKRFYSWLQ